MMGGLMKLSCCCNEQKPIVGIISEVLKINEFKLLLQWVKANVGIVSEILKTNEFELLPNKRKAMLGLFPKYFENQLNWIAFAMSESQCWDCF